MCVHMLCVNHKEHMIERLFECDFQGNDQEIESPSNDDFFGMLELLFPFDSGGRGQFLTCLSLHLTNL